MKKFPLKMMIFVDRCSLNPSLKTSATSARRLSASARYINFHSKMMDFAFKLMNFALGFCIQNDEFRKDALDALGNTTAAVGKGFAAGSAMLSK